MKSGLPNRYSKLHKLGSALQQISKGKRKVTFTQWHTLVKKFQRALRKATLSLQPAAKACSVLALSVLLSKEAAAQCNTFLNANAANPIRGVQGNPGTRAPYFVDIDGDGDLDCYVQDGYYDYNTPHLLRNVGNSQFPVYKYDPNGSGFDGISLSLPTSKEQFVDIDGDGDYDCFLAEGYPIGGTFQSLRILYFENVGTAKQPKFVENEAKNILGNQFGIYTIQFSFADIDGDGDLDVHVTTDFFDQTYLNTGTRTNPQLTEYPYDSSPYISDRTYYDWNHDGLLDYFTYQGYYFKNTGPKDTPHYVRDDSDAPHFKGIIPIQFTDLNGDGQADIFDEGGTYATLSPVPTIDTSHATYHGKSYLRLSSHQRGTLYTYQWFRNGVKIAGATAPSLPVLKSGVYSLTITNGCGTGYSLPLQVQVDTTGNNPIAASKVSDDFASTIALKIISYPNPFSNTITVQLPSSLPAAVVQITDMAGRFLIHQPVSGNAVTFGNNLAAGTYLLQVISSQRVVYTQKIVKE